MSLRQISFFAQLIASGFGLDTFFTEEKCIRVKQLQIKFNGILHPINRKNVLTLTYVILIDGQTDSKERWVQGQNAKKFSDQFHFAFGSSPKP